MIDDAHTLALLVAAVLGLGATASLFPALEPALWVGAGIGLVLVLIVAAVRRELRLRRRLAEIRPIDAQAGR